MEKKKLYPDIYLSGDVRFTENATEIFRESDNHKDFLYKLQDLMKEFGVVKIDVSIDPYLF